MAKSKKGPVVHTAESILEECAKQVRQGLGKKRVSKAAKDYWIDNASRSIASQLANGGNWTVDKKRVLPIAKKMGKVAAALATGNLVLLWAAEAAAEAVQADPGCPGGLGAGGYCDF